MLKIAHHSLYNHPLKENHRFPMIKYELIPEQLIIENTCVENNFFKPSNIEDSIILLTHEKYYYEKLKKQRSEFLWTSLEKVIPDVRSRVKVEMTASPLTHKRFLRRHKGSYGPALPAGQISFPGPKTEVKGLLRCGDSVFPGIGVPAVAVSGINAANSIAPVWKHLFMLKSSGDLNNHKKKI